MNKARILCRFLWLPCLGVGVVHDAHADGEARPTVEACADAFVDAQKLQREGKLVRAHQKAIACANLRCPAPVTKECTTLAREIESSIPTIVLSVRDKFGKDRSDVTLFVDGVQVTQELTGRAVQVDPGQRVISVVVEGDPWPPRTLNVLEGIKNERVQFIAPSEESHALGVPSTKRGVEQRPSMIPASVYLLAGVGAAGLATFGYFAVTGKQQEKELIDRCQGACDETEARPIRRKYLVADIGLGVGLLAFGTAGYLWMRGGGSSMDGVSIQAGSTGVMTNFGGQF